MTIAARVTRLRRVPFVVGLCALFMAFGSTPVFADTPSSGGDVAVAQTLGDRDLTIVLRRVTAVPGPLRVDVVTHTGSLAGRLSMSVTPTGSDSGSSALPAPGAPTARGSVLLGQTPGTYSTTMAVDRPGPWELAVGDGLYTARIPFVVSTQAVSPAENLVYGGFIAAGVLLLVSVVVATRSRRSGWVLLPVGGTLTGLAVALTAAALTTSLPLPPQPGSQRDPTVGNATNPYALSQPLVTDYSRPPVLLTLDGAPLTAGRPGDIGLDLVDAATGVPVDDLVVHDSALIHLLVVGPTGRIWHLHPIRIAPGRFQVHLSLPEAGHYAVSAELVRRGGGVQLVRSAPGLEVLPSAGPPSAEPTVTPVRLGDGPMSASTAVDATSITVVTTEPVAGQPVTVGARVGDTADLQPWLGMVGHLIVAGPLPPGSPPVGTAVQNAPVWAHAHSMGGPLPMPGMGGMAGMADMGGGNSGMIGMAPVNGDSAPDETVAAYGPDVPFTFTFPVAGQYRLWIQVELHYTLLTVPIVLDVAAAGGMSR